MRPELLGASTSDAGVFGAGVTMGRNGEVEIVGVRKGLFPQRSLTGWVAFTGYFVHHR